MSAIDRLIDYWRSANIPLERPANQTELHLLQRELGAPLPEDLKAFYALANGMPDLGYDQHQMSFWSIEKILSEKEGTAEQIPTDASQISPSLISSSIPGFSTYAFATAGSPFTYKVLRKNSTHSLHSLLGMLKRRSRDLT